MFPFADQFSYLYIYHASIVSVFVDAGTPTFIYDFPEGLDLKTVEDLYAQLEAAIKAGVRPDEIARIQNAIMRKTHASDEEGMRRYLVRSRFIPLLGFTNAMILQVAAMGYVTKEDVVFYFNQDRIFTDAEQANPAFYKLSYREQLTLVQEQQQLIASKLPAASAGTSSFARLSLDTSASPAPAVPAAA